MPGEAIVGAVAVALDRAPKVDRDKLSRHFASRVVYYSNTRAREAVFVYFHELSHVVPPPTANCRPEAFRCIGEEMKKLPRCWTIGLSAGAVFPTPDHTAQVRAQRAGGTSSNHCPLPESLQQRCIAAPGLLAQVIVSKYCDHLYRCTGADKNSRTMLGSNTPRLHTG
jgi:hypothetical protein